MIPVKVTKISYHAPSKSYAVILQELTGNKCMPVIIGSFEAQSIALALESINPPRPLTHDLICNILNGADSKLKTIRINNLEDGVFYAQLEIQLKSLKSITIDSRPSDALAIALRMNATILVSEDILASASMPEQSNSEQRMNASEDYSSINTLKEKLEDAIQDEEYEKAAELRDKIIDLES